MLNQPRGFWHLFGADLIVRSAYQMGKTPVLPMFAAAIGAGELMIGTIVAVSTMTGMVAKPFVGAFSDRWGRKVWFFAALLLFAGTPFLYRFVETPEQLLAIRLFHGSATAIFGPVTLAIVAEMERTGRATRLGWFGLARELGYLLAPAVSGWLLVRFDDPAELFTVVGLISCLAFLPSAFLRFPETPVQAERGRRPNLLRQLASGFAHTATRVEMWFAGCLEMTVYAVTYGLKAFLPLFVVQVAGFSWLDAGLFFTVQEAAHMAMRPVGGRVGDRAGYLPAIAAGIAVLAVALLWLPGVSDGTALLAVAMLSGTGQGLIFPSTVAMVGNAVGAGHLGLGLGIYGTLKNLGKVAGPLIAGLVLEHLSYEALFRALAGLAVMASIGVLLVHRHQRRLPDPGSGSSEQA
ncbi:MAG: MFS transporter [Thalassobaculum sp.]|uniref:MFS transporter n=1 Tax=Thalassobaculum sp. TaxID=2022740 RepID=UPI0032EC6375